MKISFCSIAFRRSAEQLGTNLSTLATLGYQGVEIWSNHLQENAKAAPAVNEQLRSLKLSCPMISPYFNVTGSRAQWEDTLAQLKTYLHCADLFSAPLLRVFTGFLGSKEVDPAGWKIAVERLDEMARLAADHDVALALETHPKTLVDTVEATEYLFNKLTRENIGLNLDIYHLWERHGDPLMIWSRLKPLVRHIHAKNALIPPGNAEDYPLFHDKQGKQEIDGVVYLKDGQMDYVPFIGKLIDDGFSGWISIEWFGSEPHKAAEHEINWLNSVISNNRHEKRCCNILVGKGLPKIKETPENS